MAKRFFDYTADERTEILETAAAASGRPPHLLEKDVWVVWILSALFESSLAEMLTFKGGTSLSKVYRVIDRFSEDIDLTYDIRALLPDLVRDGPLPATKSQAKKWTDTVRARLPEWIRAQVEPVVRGALARDRIEAEVSVGGPDEDKLFVDYDPLRRGTGYVSPQVVLEFGARSTGEPHEHHTVRCDVAKHVPSVDFPVATALVMQVARTFWEKATAAHVHCRQAKLRGERFSRHWYDLAQISKSSHFAAALRDRAVALAVAEHKSWFFTEKDSSGASIDYRSAVAGSLELVPLGEARDALRADYSKMAEDGVLAITPGFEELMETCGDVESRANEAVRQ